MKSIIIGAGTYGEVYLAYLQEAGVNVVGFLDDDPKYADHNVRGIPVLGPISKLDTLKKTDGIEAVYCPLGNNKLRVQFLTKARNLGYKTPNYIHPSVIISPNVIIGEGVAVGSMSLINKSLEAWGIYAGIPCRLLKPRRKNLFDFVNE